MQFESFHSILYSDTLVPDVFITDYLPSLDGNDVRIYLYCLFLSKHNKNANINELSKKLGIESSKSGASIQNLVNLGILEVNRKSIVLVDLKDKEIKKLYRFKTTSSPLEVKKNMEQNKKRNETLEIISKEFFHSMMPPGWYYDIDMWFDKYKFDEDVMYSLLKYCYTNNSFNKPYITKVAESWCKSNVISYADLENYFMEYEKVKSVSKKIIHKLNLGRMLTDYEEAIVTKWISEYRYAFDIIELALKKTVKISSPNINYIDSILTAWHKYSLTTKEQIDAYEKQYFQKKFGANTGSAAPGTPNNGRPNSSPRTSTSGYTYAKKTRPSTKDNFEQRKYDEDFLEGLYKNVGGLKTK